MSEESKHHMFTSLPTESKVIATASAKIYHAPFNSKPDEWTYSGLTGTLVFGRNRITSSDRKGGSSGETFEQWFRLVDPAKGVIWFHPIQDTLDYRLDKPFFHIFSGRVSKAIIALDDLTLTSLSTQSRMFGFRFDEDAQATKFLKKVMTYVRVKGELHVVSASHFSDLLLYRFLKCQTSQEV
jgi:neural Wiskott-Aldrich syndrome protein